MRRVIYLFLISILSACAPQEREPLNEVTDMEIPLSYLSFRIKFPVDEIQKGVNRVIPKIILDDDLTVNGSVDELYLKIEKVGDLDMAIRNTTVYGTIPLKVYVGVTKTFLGIRFSNKESPIAFAGDIRVSSEVRLNENWDLDLTCQWLGIDWKKNPEIKILGMTIDLRVAILKALEDHKAKFTLALCNEIESSVKLGENIRKIWERLQYPIRIAKKPVEIWLYFEPELLNGQLIPYERDTLAVHLEYRTTINLTTNLPDKVKITKIPKRLEPFSTRPSMVAHANLNLPMSFVRQRVAFELQDQVFEYRGHAAKISQVEVTGYSRTIEVTFQVAGDLDGEFKVRGTPVLDKDLKLVLEDFEYQIKTDNIWVKATDILFHPFIATYIASQVSIEMKDLLLRLDSLAMDGIEKTGLGQKIDPYFSFNQFSTNQLLIKDDTLNWLIDVDGVVELQLKEGLIRRTEN